MAKREWTDEERAEFGAKMKAKREKKKQSLNEQELPAAEVEVDLPDLFPVDEPQVSGSEPQVTISQEDYKSLLTRMQELEAAQWRKSQDQGSISTAGGRLTGTYEKYKMGADLYPDPRDRLSIEPKLARFAFQINFELIFTVNESVYETIDGIRTKEPKFQLDLIKIVMDEETGDPTNGRYFWKRLIMHEDPDAALVIARDNGIEVQAENEPDFLNEMRYLRMRDWLLEIFYPSKNNQTQKNRRETVINGQLVEFFEVSSETSAAMPFNQMDGSKKLR